MTEDIRVNDHNEEVEFEREDLSPRSFFIFFIALALGCVLVYFILRGMYSYLDAYENRHQPPPRPIARRAQPAPSTLH